MPTRCVIDRYCQGRKLVLFANFSLDVVEGVWKAFLIFFNASNRKPLKKIVGLRDVHDVLKLFLVGSVKGCHKSSYRLFI